MHPHAVYMIGHSRHPWPRFMELLALHQVEVLVDVLYAHTPELGGRNPLPLIELGQHLERILNLPMWGPSRMCLMCSEGDYHECHRHYLLAPLVLKLGR